MAFLIRFPDGFVPEEHGWEAPDVEVKDNLPQTWLRWEIPFKFPASLTQCLHDEASGAIGGWFFPVTYGVRDEMTYGELKAMLLNRA